MRENRTYLSSHKTLGFSPFKRKYPKLGRNDKCFCGSGNKYKKCCLGKER